MGHDEVRSAVVDVWTAQERPHPVLWELLDAGERDRAAGLGQDRAERFVAARGLVRGAAAQLLGCAARDVVLRVRCPACGGPHGRVLLGSSGPAEQAPVHVSITRAGPVVAVALTVAGPVGVDVEAVAAVSAQPVERVALSDRERRAIQRLPPDARPEALAEAWVRKEAALKALGTGLSVDPRAIRLSGRLRGAGRGRMSGGGASLTTAMLALGPGVAGAVALARAGRHRPSLQVELHDGDALLARLT